MGLEETKMEMSLGGDLEHSLQIKMIFLNGTLYPMNLTLGFMNLLKCSVMDLIFTFARTDPGGPFWSKDNPLLNILPAWEHHLYDLVEFSFRQHGTAIWRLNQESGSLEPLLQLEGCGDTAFPSIIRLSLHESLILNYSSPFDACPANWLEGQVSPNGTLIYSQLLEFVPED